MDVMNGTSFALDATQAIDKVGQPWLVVLAKASYRIPDDPAERRPELMPQQRGLLAADLFEGRGRAERAAGGKRLRAAQAAVRRVGDRSRARARWRGRAASSRWASR